jgi:2-methylcitrate dehydratase PrpD
MSPTEVIARHIVGCGHEDLSATAVETAKRLILDALATTIGGSPCAWCHRLEDVGAIIRLLGPSDG